MKLILRDSFTSEPSDWLRQIPVPVMWVMLQAYVAFQVTFGPENRSDDSKNLKRLRHWPALQRHLGVDKSTPHERVSWVGHVFRSRSLTDRNNPSKAAEILRAAVISCEKAFRPALTIHVAMPFLSVSDEERVQRTSPRSGDEQEERSHQLRIFRAYLV
jgi:hypothetical protein